MFNFKDQYNKVSQKQCSNSVKNLRKELPKQSPFRYGSKKISFNVKNRSDYWDDIEKVYVNEQARIDSIIGNVLQNLMNGKDTDYDIADSVMYSPVSPVLATTLIMLNKALFQCKTFGDYMDSNEAQVYAYTHWNGKNFVTNPTALVIDNPFGNETEKYKKILPGYSKISAMNFYKGYQVYVTDYSSNSPVSSTTAAVSNDSKYWGSYHIDTKRFQRVFATKPDLDRVESGSIVSNVTFKDSEGMEVETLNMHPELDSYLYADGIFKKLMDSPYNSQSYQISVLRGGYGFGPINIACFLKAKEFDIERITDIISGLLIAEDSGMPLIDAIRGIQEWRISVHDTDIDTIFDSLSDIRILRYIEYIGSIFFTAILGSSLKEKPLINIPLTSAERKIYDVGYLMGHNYDIFVQMFKNGIKNKIWLKDSTEIFSFEVPCVLYGTEPTNGIFKIGDYVKNYSDSLLLGSEPLDYAFNVSSILEKEKALTDYIIPAKGYTIFDFVTKGLNKSLIEYIINYIDVIDNTDKKYYNNFSNDFGIIDEQVSFGGMRNIEMRIPIDFCIAPRDQTTKVKDTNVNYNIVYPIYQTEYNTNWKIISRADHDRVSASQLIVNGTKAIYIYDKKKDYGFLTRTLYINTNGNLITEGYYLTDATKYKKFIVLSSVVNTDVNKVSKAFYGNNYDIPFTPIDKLIDIEKNTSTYKKFPDSCICIDSETNEIYNFGIYYYVESSSADNSPYYEILETINKPQINLLSDVNQTSTDVNLSKSYNQIYLSSNQRLEMFSRIMDLRGLPVNIAILQMFSACGMVNYNYSLYKYDVNDETNQIYDNLTLGTLNYLNRFALCILKLSVINAFCMSYSIDLLSLPDSVRSFYDIYKSYLSDFIDIKQEIQN